MQWIRRLFPINCLILFVLQVDLFAGGTVTFKVTTVTYGGHYSEKNIGAIWVANSQEQFVKTLEVWAKKRIQHLVKWNDASNGNVVDAITSATLRSHESHSVSWNCTDVNGSEVADGIYKIFVEFTEDNSSKSGQPQGKWTSVVFTKGSSDQKIAPPDETNFINMELIYSTTGTSPTASLSGIVKEADTNQPIENATLQLKLGSNVQHEIKSDASGLYSISNIEPGTYTLIGLKSGYSTFSQDVTLNSGQQMSGIEIILTPASDTTPPIPPENVRVTIQN